MSTQTSLFKHAATIGLDPAVANPHGGFVRVLEDMLTEFELLIDTNTVSCVERLALPAQAERSVPIPDAYGGGSAGRWLLNDAKLEGRLWLHQAKALTIAAEGRNLVISTGTASRKSWVFQSAAFRVLDEDEQAAVIVFYPLKALSNDQLSPSSGRRDWPGGARGAPRSWKLCGGGGAACVQALREHVGRVLRQIG